MVSFSAGDAWMEFLNKGYCKKHITKTASPGALLQSPKRENSHGNAFKNSAGENGRTCIIK